MIFNRDTIQEFEEETARRLADVIDEDFFEFADGQVSLRIRTSPFLPEGCWGFLTDGRRRIVLLEHWNSDREFDRVLQRVERRILLAMRRGREACRD